MDKGMEQPNFLDKGQSASSHSSGKIRQKILEPGAYSLKCYTSDKLSVTYNLTPFS